MNPNLAVVTIRDSESDIAFKALSPEAGRDVPRSHIRLRKGEGSFILSIEANDVATLRAALNSYLRWANVAMNVAKEVKE